MLSTDDEGYLEKGEDYLYCLYLQDQAIIWRYWYCYFCPCGAMQWM